MESKNKQMTDLELKTIIDNQIKNGIGSGFNELSNTRQDNLDRYLGELYGYEVEGESKVVTRDVLETVEWAMPSIIRVFASQHTVVEFEPEDADDEQAAEQETWAVNKIFQKDNKGFIVLHNFIKSALLNPNSYAKIYFDETEKVTREEYENLTEFDLAQLMQDPELEPEEQEEITEIMMVDGVMQPVTTYDVVFKRTRKKGKHRVTCVPEEEIIVGRDHSELNLDDADFVCHRVERSYSDLVADGYDKEKLESIGTDNDEGDYNEERVNRRYYNDENDYYDSDEYDKTQRRYWLHECYIRVDYDGDDYAELRRVVKIGNEIFENEECDDIPIVSATSILMPHKHVGLSYVELVKDLQEIRTYILRQTLTNLYRVNNPRTIVGRGVNLDDLLGNSNNGIIRTDDMNNIRGEPIQPVIGHVIPAMELLNNERESRTGISKNSKGLDADVLSQSTKGAYLSALEQAGQRIELIVRLLAETGIKDIFLKLHAQMIKYGTVRQMKQKDGWVKVDPSEWRERDDMICRVGLGNSSKEVKLAAAQLLLTTQKDLAMSGSKTVNDKNIYEAGKLLVEAAGEINVDKYFTNPETLPPQQPQPNINLLMLELQKQVETQRHQTKQMEMQMKQQEQQFKQFMELAKEGRERAKLELEHGTDIPGGIGNDGSEFAL